MKRANSTLDGYAIRNTRDVVAALNQHRRILLKGSEADARLAAIEYYESVAGVRVTERTLHRWMEAVQSYGGLEKVPGNAFGALKSAPHVVRPFRDKVREIIKEAQRIKRWAQDRDSHGASSPDAEEASAIARSLEAIISRTHDDGFKAPMISVCALAENLERTSVHHIFRFLAEVDLDRALTDALLRLRALRQAREKNLHRRTRATPRNA
jgi:hypothetical protein